MRARALNRALLARQGLLDPLDVPLPRALERVGTIQAQYAPSMYVGLWSRTAAMPRDDLTRALERRAVVQATLIRATIHLCSPEDYWPIVLAVRDARRLPWQRTYGIADAEMEAAADRLRPAIAAGPMHRRDIEALVGRPHAGGVGLWLDLVRVPPSGTWERRRADLYALAEDWVGPPGDATAQAGVELLVRRRLGGFGPATPKEIANFAGIPVREVTEAVERMDLQTLDGGLLDLADAPLPHPETPVPVRFLPTWDATLLVHCRAAGVLPEDYRPRIFGTKTPQSFPTFLVDGAVAGTWRFEGGRIKLEPFARLDAAVRRELEGTAERLAAFHA